MTRETLDDLYNVEGKAELIAGRIVHFMPSGDLPSSAAFEIAVSLRAHAKTTGNGRAYTDGVGYSVPELLSGRESFSPDASFYDGPLPINRMRFIEGAPQFAAEVRSENDYGPAAESKMAAKRADYFAAGTLVVWDVDPEAKTVAMYKSTVPTQAIVFHAGDIANAEPAVPGWRLAVDDIFVE
ncbi:MAG: Uma2 family endonuclease [Planctomycetes bacterium]|nr:Uma2 family endonuclease [Planctomycetota bacterium]